MNSAEAKTNHLHYTKFLSFYISIKKDKLPAKVKEYTHKKTAKRTHKDKKANRQKKERKI